MAVKSSGSLSLTTDIVGEFGGTAPHSLSEYYGGAGLVPAGANPSVATSGQTNMGSYYDAVAATVLTISSNTDNYDIGSAVTSAGGDKNTPVILTINSGVTVGSTSSGTAAMYTGTGWGSGVTINITNNGSIVGASGSNTTATTGGAGGNGGYGSRSVYPAPSGSSGSNANPTPTSANNGGNAFEHSQTADNNLSVVFDTAGTRTGGSAGTISASGGGGGGGAGGRGGQAQNGGGGGGGGASYGSGAGSQCPDITSPAQNGTATTGGRGGHGLDGLPRGCVQSGSYYSGAGGYGGNLGSSGNGGYEGRDPSYQAPGSGGSSGSSGNNTGSAGSALAGNTGQIS